MADEKVRVRIKPLHNIGGIGRAGDEVWMSPEEAEMYLGEGYVEFVVPQVDAISGQQTAISDQQAAGSPASGIFDGQQSAVSDQQAAGSGQQSAEEAAQPIMKPEVKRAKGARSPRGSRGK